ncbi:hypothetical protein BSP109_02895 [Brevibacterium sp. Mu109]|uniref:peptidyl-tRNA hydrolase n=1 Tax=Brevibacterium sp. Mu109 TaxID=1255669 RepID=UPI000C5B73C3|nr:peptidyl-tRNA hydrolase [Brevibacterium sp. Mu109]SMX95705.1 hypothetical protein BSP109_02895 [Brevibacterium sp. Mu109]
MSEADAETGTADSACPDVSRMRRHESDHDIPWALPVVVRRSKTHIARHVDVLEAAAEAVVTFLDDPRSQPEGEWHEALEHWRHGAIRKVVRRGDGKQFEDAAALGCVRVQRDSAHGFGPVDVLVLPPGPVQPLPRELKKLQVGGTEFPLGVSESDDGSADPATTSSATTGALVVIELTPAATLTTGKAAAQCGHAAQLAYEQMPDQTRAQWRAADFRVRVEFASDASWASAPPAPVRVVDAGFTEVNGPTETARARWSHP